MSSNKYLSQYMITACKQHPEYGRSLTYTSISEGVGPAIRISAYGQDFDFRFSESPFNEKEVVDFVTDKERAQEVLSSHIMMPETRIFPKNSSISDIATSIRNATDFGELDYPLVIKPNKESLSLGVFIIRDDTQLEESLKKCADISCSSTSILVQDYIPSDMELRVIVFEGDIAGIINKNLSDIECNRIDPAVENRWGKAALIHDRDLEDRLSEISCFLHEKHALVYGGLDIRIDSRSGDLYLLEINPAPMGYQIFEYDMAGGLDLVQRITHSMLDKIISDSKRNFNISAQSTMVPDIA